MSKKLFCELCPATYWLSRQKCIVVRRLRNLLSRTPMARTRQQESLPVLVTSHTTHMIKRGPGIDPRLQQNKADNIRLAASRMDGLVIMPGETFSFWLCVGQTSRRNGFKDGRVLVNGKLQAGTGGGLCNLANTLHLLAIHSPLTVTELHHHSDALAPDPDGRRVPYSAGTSVNWNYLDLRFLNTTDQPLQLRVRCEGDELHAELRTTQEYPFTYRLSEEDHHFHREADGHYYRISRIYRETLDRQTGRLLDRQLKWRNHSRVHFDPSLIPPEQIR